MVDNEDNLFFLNRNTLSDTGPEVFRTQPERALTDLLNGCIRIMDQSLLPYYPLNGKNAFGTARNPYQSGVYSYNTYIALPAELRSILPEEMVVLNERRGERVPFAQLVDMRIWDRAEIPPEHVGLLLPYSSVYGGYTYDKNPLTKVFVGKKIRGIMRQLDINLP